MTAPLITVPALRQEGYEAMLRGLTMRLPGHPLGFCFCHYPVGSTERANFLSGCIVAVFGVQ